MSAELVKADDLNSKIEWAKTLAVANLLPKQYQGNPGNLLYAVEYADALGIDRINAITSIHVINGKPTASADLIASLVRRAGHKLRVSGDDKMAMAQLVRADDPDFTFEAHWDMDKAKAAGLLGNDVWRKYPGAMLRARAITEVCRAGASDALFGVIYTPEEAGANVDEEGAPVASVVPLSGADTRLAAESTALVNAEDEPVLLNTSSKLAKALYATLRDKGVDKDGSLALFTDIAGRDITSSKELTEDEARALLKELDSWEAPVEGEVEE